MTRTRGLILAGRHRAASCIGGLAFEIITHAARARGDADLLRALHDRQSARPRRSESGSHAARSLCSTRYLKTHPLAVAAEGGLVGIPRNINKNFKAWREGPNVWICPTNRIGPVYQFVFEDGGWRFDGPVGILRPWGEMVPMSDLPEWSDRRANLA